MFLERIFWTVHFNNTVKLALFGNDIASLLEFIVYFIIFDFHYLIT